MQKSIRTRLSHVVSNSFVRNVGVLVGGTAFAQALTVLILPFLTRLYSPDDFAVLAVYASLLGIFASIACLRLEIAIPIPESDEEAANLLILAMTISGAIAAILGLAVWIYPDHLVELTGQPKLAPYLWLIPVGVLLSGAFTALQYWATRHKKFGLIAQTRIGQASTGAAVQLSCGWGGLTPVGLLLGQLIYSGAGVLRLGAETWQQHRKALASVQLGTMLETLRRYDRFPKYSTPEALANGVNLQLPVLIIASFAAGPEAGFLLLATRVMAAPMGLVGGAIAQVYLSRAPEERRQGRLSIFTFTTLNGLMKTGVGPLLFIGIIAPIAFPIAFGSEWSRAGEIVSWMTPWFIFQFLASPVSMILHITENQKTALLLQLAGMIIRVGLVIAAVCIAKDYVVEAYAISGLLFYLIYFFVVLRIANIRLCLNKFMPINVIGVLMGWMAIAYASAHLLKFAQVYLSHAQNV